MKFAKELEQELVPEWRAKYLNYKLGKKKIKAITRALRTVENTPRIRGFALSGHDVTPRLVRPSFRRLASQQKAKTKGTAGQVEGHQETTHQPSDADVLSTEDVHPESQPLRSPVSRFAEHSGGYGSIVTARSGGAPSLELPDPALDPSEPHFHPYSHTSDLRPATSSERPRQTLGYGQWFRPRSDSMPFQRPKRKNSIFQRMFTSRPDYESPMSDPPAEALHELKNRENEFFNFLDKQLAKVEGFYRSKEEESTERLMILREQLHVMRDLRAEELKSKAKLKLQGRPVTASNADSGSSVPKWKKPLGKSLTAPAKYSKELEELPTPGPALYEQRHNQDYRDFVRRQDHDVSYRSAKRKLKVALLEFYRGLELLKSYAYLNRKAFRKINKKYDKATNARPTMRYVSEKVNRAWFVQSDLIENHLVVVEDLYTKYFERGNRKVAVTKLRGKGKRSQDYSPNAFRSGLLLAAGLVFGIQGVAYAIEHLVDDEPGELHVRTSYLLQIYGGYTLIDLHFLFFCLNCRIWTRSKINYVFVFEYDTRHVLDWRQLAEIPCLFFFLLGFFIWLNFRFVNSMYIYWPVVLIALTVLIMFFPARTLYHRSRKWWAYSNWRLLLAGLYPVEFRDFFLGDMYCSQTYAMGNVALFFCLYSASWVNPPHCNSSHSRLMGFFSTLPSIWRALQCLRRYRDTKNLFPHIVNFGKYTFSILYYVSLSVYRIRMVEHYRALFITLACINAIYSSVWDLAMDWSLLNPVSKNAYLRDYLGFRTRWVYYAAMILDVVLRFNWIFYAIFSKDVQHSAILSFIVSLSEVCRRGIWTIFRVENEHCTNVCRFRASRDVPLPYDIPTEASIGTILQTKPSSGAIKPALGVPVSHLPAPATGVDIESHAADGTLRHRPGSHRSETSVPSGTLARMGTMMAHAHAQDFERRKKPGAAGKSPGGKEADDGSPEREHGNGLFSSSTSDEDEEEYDEEVEIEASRSGSEEDESGGLMSQRNSSPRGSERHENGERLGN